MHITITGNLGSGKSTICKFLNEHHGFEVFSTGKIQRKLAEDFNMSTLEMNRLMSQDTKFDRMIDNATVEIANSRKADRLIFDSRLAWHFVPHSFKVFLFTDIDTAATRIINDDRAAEAYTSIEDCKNKLLARAAEEKVRYRQIYNLDYFDYANYDLIMDTSFCRPDEAAEIILRKAKDFYSDNPYAPLLLVSPNTLAPACEVTDENRLSFYVNSFSGAAPYPDTEIIASKDGDRFTVVDGRVRVAACIKNNISFIRVKLK